MFVNCFDFLLISFELLSVMPAAARAIKIRVRVNGGRLTG